MDGCIVERLFKLGGDELGDIMQPESRENQVMH